MSRQTTSTDARMDKATVAGCGVNELLELARQAQAQRKAAPLVTVTGDFSIPQKDMIKRLAAKTGGNNAKGGYHHICIPQENARAYAQRGYEVVWDEDLGQVATYESDVVVRCPTDMWLQIDAANRAKSNRMVSGSVKKHRQDINANKAAVDSEMTVAQVGPARSGTTQETAPSE